MSDSSIRCCIDCESTSELRAFKNDLILCEPCIQSRVEERDKALEETELGPWSVLPDEFPCRRRRVRPYEGCPPTPRLPTHPSTHPQNQ